MAGVPELSLPGGDASHASRRTGLVRVFAGIENGVLALALALIVLVPLTESLLRATLHVGISGSSAILQHLVLVVGMLGGAVAAREGRMLSLSTADAFLKGDAKRIAHLASFGFAAGIAAFLALAGIQFVESEKDSGALLAYGLPLWIAQAVIPLGFTLVALRLLWRAGETWRPRAAACVVFAIVIAVGWLAPIDPEKMLVPSLVVLGQATLLGAPIFVTLGGAALILHWTDGSPISSISVDHYRLVTNPSLATLPLFTLAGYCFAEGGASKRLIRVFQTCFGGVRGGPAIVTTLVCAFFTSFTGASGVTILALGGLLMPILIEARYSERSALGLVTGAGSLGLLLPPCLPLILYAIIARIPMETMFLGGILPGIVMMVLTAWWGIRQGPRIVRSSGPGDAQHRFDLRAAWSALWIAKWELALPIVALASLFGGFATPIEAAAITALYAFFVEVVIYRDLSITSGVPRVLVECGLLIGGVLLILGVALGFTNWLVEAEVPSKLLDAVTASVQSPWLFLLLLNLFLLVVGSLMDIFSAIVVVVPLIVPLGEHYGIDPVHLGIVFLANLELGYLAPPVGMNLMIASYRFRKPMSQVYRAVIPMLIVLFVGVLLITYVPWMTTWLPRFFGH